MLDRKTLLHGMEAVKSSLERRGLHLDDELQRLLTLEARRKEMLVRHRGLREEQKRDEKVLVNLGKDNPEGQKVLCRLRERQWKQDELKVALESLDEELSQIYEMLPNLLSTDVPAQDEGDRIVYETQGWKAPVLDYDPKTWNELAIRLGIVCTTGQRRTFQGGGARLLRALQNHLLDTLAESGALEMTGCPLDCCTDRVLVLEQISRPMCFCKEVGVLALYQITTAGREQEIQEEMGRLLTRILENLGLRVRMKVPTAPKTRWDSMRDVQVEVYLAQTCRFEAVGILSSFGTFHARELRIRHRGLGRGGPQTVATVECERFDLTPLLWALLEMGQNDDGTVTVPQVLQSQFGDNKIQPIQRRP